MCQRSINTRGHLWDKWQIVTHQIKFTPTQHYSISADLKTLGPAVGPKRSAITLPRAWLVCGLPGALRFEHRIKAGHEPPITGANEEADRLRSVGELPSSSCSRWCWMGPPTSASLSRASAPALAQTA